MKESARNSEMCPQKQSKFSLISAVSNRRNYTVTWSRVLIPVSGRLSSAGSVYEAAGVSQEFLLRRERRKRDLSILQSFAGGTAKDSISVESVLEV